MVAGAVICAPAFSQEASRISGDGEALINRLTDVSELGYGYSAMFSGSQFLPQADADEVHTLVLGSQRPTKSTNLEAIVRLGINAVPALLKHLDDGRKTHIAPVKGMMWMSFADEYDFNRRARKQSPDGVNRGHTFGENAPSSHQITVGDLCYVALGQILNRSFSATRYQPTGGLVVSSPTYSKRLCAVVREDWQGLTEEKHRQSLILDFLNPDNEDRRIGAYRRLAFYYPQSVEPLVLKQLSVPTFDTLEVDHFVREHLYQEKSKINARKIFDEFVERHGTASSNGILLQLFGDLGTQEADEQGRLHPPLKEKYDARAMLTLLYGYPTDVKSSQVFVDTWAATEKARFIEALVHDSSKRIGDAVEQAFLQNPKDDYLGPACLRCLASRGYAPLLVAQLQTIDLGVVEPNPLQLECIEAISTSKEQAVRDKLLDILQRTRSTAYFMAALEGVNQSKDDTVLVLAKRVLEGLPEDTDQGENMLQMIGERYPGSARQIFKDFLKTGSARRAETMCRVLWYGSPLSKEILAPLLDDKRDLDGFSIPMRVCDRAAEAISHTTEKIRFDSEWTVAQKDETITKLKQYCEESTPSNQTQTTESPPRQSK